MLCNDSPTLGVEVGPERAHRLAKKSSEDSKLSGLIDLAQPNLSKLADLANLAFLADLSWIRLSDVLCGHRWREGVVNLANVVCHAALNDLGDL